MKTEPSSNVKVWATRDAGGKVHVVVINKDLSSAADITLTTDKAGRVTLKRLEAPAIAVSEGVCWAGQTFDDTKDGKPVGELKIESPTVSDGRVSFNVEPASAALISLDDA